MWCVVVLIDGEKRRSRFGFRPFFVGEEPRFSTEKSVRGWFVWLAVQDGRYTGADLGLVGVSPIACLPTSLPPRRAARSLRRPLPARKLPPPAPMSEWRAHRHGNSRVPTPSPCAPQTPPGPASHTSTGFHSRLFSVSVRPLCTCTVRGRRRMHAAQSNSELCTEFTCICVRECGCIRHSRACLGSRNLPSTGDHVRTPKLKPPQNSHPKTPVNHGTLQISTPPVLGRRSRATFPRKSFFSSKFPPSTTLFLDVYIKFIFITRAGPHSEKKFNPRKTRKSFI